MINNDITFVAGVHGVGKGTLCGKLVSIANFVHVSASDLIRRRKELDKSKKVLNPIGNQEILVQELMNYSQNNKLLLDGHFCLIDLKGNMVRLPIELFQSLNISRILLIKSEPCKIYQQILIRDSDKSGLSMEDIINLQDAEVEHAHQVSSALNIPILEISLANVTMNDEIEKVLKFI